MNEWIWAAIAVGAGIFVGAVAGRIVRGQLGKSSRPEVMQRLAQPAGSLVFTACAVVGLVVALAAVNPDSLETVPSDLVDYLPRLLMGLVVIIVGNVAAGLAAAAVDQAISRASGRSSGPVPTVVKSVILAFAAILAANQVGVDTTIITLAVASVLFSAGLAAALLVGLGGRTVSAEVAAARALRRIVSPGDRLVFEDHRGLVVAVHPTAVELEDQDGVRTLLPNSAVLSASLTIERGGTPGD